VYPQLHWSISPMRLCRLYGGLALGILVDYLNRSATKRHDGGTPRNSEADRIKDSTEESI
jgi:hypothetical protein